ncbi:MAG TPA: hypothetical protein V6D23_22365 [Candidatus Obscuribacterales bacterium]
MNKKFRYLALSAMLCSALTFAGCKEKTEEPTDQASKAPPAEATEAPASEAPPVSQKGSVSANGFSIVPPAGWTKGEPNKQAFMIYLDKAKNNFRANFNVNSSPDDGTPVNKIGPLIKPMFAKQFDKWKFMGEGEEKVAGEDSYWISSRFTMQGYDIQNLQYYIRGKNKRFYVLTFTALANSYKDYEPTFKQAVETVQTLE